MPLVRGCLPTSWRLHPSLHLQTRRRDFESFFSFVSVIIKARKCLIEQVYSSTNLVNYGDAALCSWLPRLSCFAAAGYACDQPGRLLWLMSFGAFSHQAFLCTEQQLLPAQDNRIEFAVQTAWILLAQAHLYIHTHITCFTAFA